MSEIDVVLPAGRFGAVLFGMADVVYPGFRGDLTHALCTGPSYRHHFGPFSVDLGVQGFFGPGVYPTDALGNSPITPVPTLLLRYGFPGRR